MAFMETFPGTGGVVRGRWRRRHRTPAGAPTPGPQRRRHPPHLLELHRSTYNHNYAETILATGIMSEKLGYESSDVDDPHASQ